MPMHSILLRPGVDVQKTQSLNEAAFDQSNLIRFKDGLVQPINGYSALNSAPVGGSGPPRAMHTWIDVNGDSWLAMGFSSDPSKGLQIDNFSSGAVNLTNISPQVRISSFAPNFSISSGSSIVTIVDVNSGMSVFGSVFFNTPISIGNILLQNMYPINTVVSTGSYTIAANVIASTTIASSGVLPRLAAAVAGGKTLNVTMPNNTAIAVPGFLQAFYTNNTLNNGQIITAGSYSVSSIIDSTTFSVRVDSVLNALSTVAVAMNSGVVQTAYYVTVTSSTATVGGSSGSAITASSDWSLDNWGEILIACPYNGGIYTYTPNTGLTDSRIVGSAPAFNGGIFTSQPEQILVAWKSVDTNGTQDNLVVRWSDYADYTQWNVTSQTAAGSFHIPTGSVIRGGLQAPNFGVIWTDIDAWIMQYVGGEVIFNFSRAGSGCGLIAQHAAAVIGGEVYWCGLSNFFKIGPTGVEPIPCTVWDFIFQNMNPAATHRTFCAPNSAYNEIGWFFCSGTNTECDSYVKYNLIERTWDYGSLRRSAWVDINVIGNRNPIAYWFSNAANQNLYQQETGYTFLNGELPSFTTGWWSIADGNELSFVDWVLPDFIWSSYGSATNSTVNVFFSVVDYPGDTPTVSPTYTVTPATEYLTPRLRGRLMSMTVTGVVGNTNFWRLGRVRVRFATSGRR